MSLFDFFTPVDFGKISPSTGFYSSQLGAVVDIHVNSFPDIENQRPEIAIFGVNDDRSSVNNQGCGLGPDYIREKLYSLYQGSYTVKIADLGNIKAGERVSDTYYAVKAVVSELIKNNILPVILGGGQDITYAQYMAYENLEQQVDLVVVDSRFDLNDSPENTIETTSSSYLNKIFLHQPNYLFNYSNIGYQTYFVNQESLRVMEKLFFDVHRVGEIAGDITKAEPVIRNANMLSFDISAIRSSDAFGNANAGPNGFFGDEACQICRYAGMSDKL